MARRSAAIRGTAHRLAWTSLPHWRLPGDFRNYARDAVGECDQAPRRGQSLVHFPPLFSPPPAAPDSRELSCCAASPSGLTPDAERSRSRLICSANPSSSPSLLVAPAAV